jgi:hypothetical protein
MADKNTRFNPDKALGNFEKAMNKIASVPKEKIAKKK